MPYGTNFMNSVDRRGRDHDRDLAGVLARRLCAGAHAVPGAEPAGPGHALRLHRAFGVAGDPALRDDRELRAAKHRGEPRAGPLPFSIPFALWLLRGFFQSLPADLEEAAFIDGASHLQALRLIVIPLAMPGW